MALWVKVYQQVVDVMSDCNRRYLCTVVQDIVKMASTSKSFSCYQNYKLPKFTQSSDSSLNCNENAIIADLENIPKASHQSDVDIANTAMLIIEMLLANPDYPKHSMNTSKDDTVCENIFSRQRLLQKEQSKEFTPDENGLLAVAAGGSDFRTTRLSAADSGIASPMDFDAETSQSLFLYRQEALQLLNNEFRWLFIKGIKMAFEMNNHEYLATRSLLLDLIKPALTAAEVTVEAIDPVHPQYPLRLDKTLTKTAGTKFLSKEDVKVELLKVPRKVSLAPINVSHPRLATDLATLRSSKVSAKPVNCLCCDDDVTVDTLVTCAEGHIYCQLCLTDYVKVKVQDGVKQGYLECMEHECTAPFSQVVLLSRLSTELVEKLDERVAMSNLNQADLAGLVRCPKCNAIFELDVDLKVLDCVVCKHSSCRRCGQPWDAEHRGRRCEELESVAETMLRRTYEEKMTAALIRACPKCRTPLLKTEGCNKMTCSCGSTLCYVCREPYIGYDHFCRHPRNPGMPCDQCRSCSLWIDPAADDEARIKQLGEEAKNVIDKQHSTHVNELSSTNGSENVFRKKVTSDATNLLEKLAIVEPVVKKPNVDMRVGVDRLTRAIATYSVVEIDAVVGEFGREIVNMVLPGVQAIPLHQAVSFGSLQVVRALIRHGARVSQKNATGETPLHRAVAMNHQLIVAELIGRGADTSLTNNERMTPLHVAARFGKHECARVLLDHGARHNSVEISFGCTPLHSACHYGHRAVVEILLERGADIHAQDRRGLTPLHNAAFRGNTEIIEILLTRGANPNARAKGGQTPLHSTAHGRWESVAAVRALRAAGADPSVRDARGLLPHGVAFSFRKYTLAKALAL